MQFCPKELHYPPLSAGFCQYCVCISDNKIKQIIHSPTAFSFYFSNHFDIRNANKYAEGGRTIIVNEFLKYCKYWSTIIFQLCQQLKDVFLNGRWQTCLNKFIPWMRIRAFCTQAYDGSNLLHHFPNPELMSLTGNNNVAILLTGLLCHYLSNFLPDKSPLFHRHIKRPFKNTKTG